MSFGVSLMLKSGNPSLVFKKLPSSSRPTREFDGHACIRQQGIWLQLHRNLFRRNLVLWIVRNRFSILDREIPMLDDLFFKIDFPIGHRQLPVGFRFGQAQGAKAIHGQIRGLLPQGRSDLRSSMQQSLAVAARFSAIVHSPQHFVRCRDSCFISRRVPPSRLSINQRVLFMPTAQSITWRTFGGRTVFPRNGRRGLRTEVFEECCPVSGPRRGRSFIAEKVRLQMKSHCPGRARS